MNLAEIRRKAQQQEAEQAKWQPSAAAVTSEPLTEAPPEPVVEYVPVPSREHAAAVSAPSTLADTEFEEPVLECALDDDSGEAEEGTHLNWLLAAEEAADQEAVADGFQGELEEELYEAPLEAPLEEAELDAELEEPGGVTFRVSQEDVPPLASPPFQVEGQGGDRFLPPAPAPLVEEPPQEAPTAQAAYLQQAASRDLPSEPRPHPVRPAARRSAPQRAFDPLGAILKGREDAVSGEAAAVVAEDESAASAELLCFKVAQEEYAISIMDVKEIIKPRELTEVPRTPPFVGGVLSLRGIIIPVFDLRVRLGLVHEERSPRERIIVVKRERGFCGVLVDQVVQVVRLPLSGVEPPPVVLEGIDRDFVQGIGRVDGRMLILLDMEKVLDVTLS